MKKKKVLNIIGYAFLIAVIIIFSAMIVFNATHIYYNVYGPSMSPTLNEGITSPKQNKDGVFVSKTKSYTRGDIIVIDKDEKDADGNEKYIIKRLIAIGGDKIAIRLEGDYYRIILIKNGDEEETIVEEPYLSDYSINSKTYDKFYQMIVNESLYVDRNGFLTIADDEMFYLGDNRLDSSDCASYGPMKANLVVGKVDYIVYGNSFMYLQVIKQFLGW